MTAVRFVEASASMRALVSQRPLETLRFWAVAATTVAAEEPSVTLARSVSTTAEAGLVFEVVEVVVAVVVVVEFRGRVPLRSVATQAVGHFSSARAIPLRIYT